MKYMIIFLVLVLIAGCGQEAEIQAEEPLEPTGVVREFELTAKRFDFDPPTITVNKGDSVRISMTSIDTAHGFAIDEFGINERVEGGQSAIIKFVPDKTGTFTFYCSVPCGSGHGDMKGTLVVE